MALIFFPAFLLVCALTLATKSTVADPESQALAQRTAAPQAKTYVIPQKPQEDLSKDYNLLDIILVASVDGKFHALNRHNGRPLWSMSSFPTTTSISAPSSLGPLIRTSHFHSQPNFDPDTVDEDSDEQETYIIEPQTGDIYVLHSPSAPLQRFPLSMAELVEYSPFTSVNEDKTRVFVGRKETSLVLIELETGKIKATLNSECPPIFDWDKDKNGDEIDLDELEEDSSQVSTPTEVYIGRTDYHVTIWKKPLPGQRAPPPQNLSFSTYGPNNKDNHLQSIYRRSRDDTYIQSFPNGNIMSFHKPSSQRSGETLWGRPFSAPIVAVFDVLQAHHSSHAFVLLQPRQRLQELFPQIPDSKTQSAYVGIVEETGSLFAMSPEQYPLVVFGGPDNKMVQDGDKHKDIAITRKPKPTYRPEGDLEDIPIQPHDVDDTQSLLDKCLINPYDVRCLVGLRALEDEGGSEGRTKRLIDPPKTQLTHMPVVFEPGKNRDDNASGSVRPPPERLSLPAPSQASWLGIGPPGSGQPGAGVWEALIVTIALGLVSVYFLWRRVKKRVLQAVEQQLKEESGSTRSVELSIPPSREPTTPSTPSILKELPPLPSVNGEVPDGEIPHLSSGPSLPNSQLLMPPDASAAEDGDETEGEGPETPATPGKKKARRGKRGRKKKLGVNTGSPELEDQEDPSSTENKASPSLILTTTTPKPPVVQSTSLVVSDTILGFGSHGTVVFQGSLQGRAVAVKRLLQDFVTLAAREVSILQESDDHPNVIRYYYQESHSNFLYIALELCPASLADIIENPNQDQWRDIAINFDPKKALKQITSGLRHLHGLKLIHRDIKPQNILISSVKGGAPSNTFGAKNGKGGAYRMLISDFGLCKKLDVDQTSFLPTAQGAMAAGTVGWRAPEILRGEVKLDEFTNEDGGSFSSRGSNTTVLGNASIGSSGSSGAGRPVTRLTKAVDIFALGCLFYYTVTNGGHPYGDRFEREGNIIKDAKDLAGLDRFGEEGTEAKNLIAAMLDPEAKQRPDTTTCLLHPFFWDAGRRLNFLQDASDRFEIMCRDPKDPDLLTLERGAFGVVGNDWHARLDKVFIDNLGKFRKYDGKSVQDLLRALRNKKHHYQDLPENVKRHLGPMPEGYLGYFTRRYPQLFLHVHGVIKETGLHSESMFRTYFELPES
ncbi:hypothetical protein CPB83DRAFT_850528 [Crepidotus variabilis]|uniref:non-specific serine/threonine protein kinase n=1 Tax=Crepidotus variabilis TaxID=179855 RepID=A0A9P6JRA3_9AGAR|nr:hypothetical protein CPB83DRAFT_850528 [Crepidotus variabilis]